MITLLYIEEEPEKQFYCGFRIHSKNWYEAPHGRIRIARFETCFCPTSGHGYYGDIYFNKFIRKWRDNVILKKRRYVEKIMTILCISKKQILNNDVLRKITEFI